MSLNMISGVYEFNRGNRWKSKDVVKFKTNNLLKTVILVSLKIILTVLKILLWRIGGLLNNKKPSIKNEIKIIEKYL